MDKLTTSGIEIEVYSCYLNQSSTPENSQYVFGYDITITNQNSFTVQLLSRKWSIIDSLSRRRQVEGKGVIGEQPILQPGESYHYQSFCDLASDIGWMKGVYFFARLDTEEQIKVSIPQFELATLSKVN